MIAHTIALHIQAYCQVCFPNDPLGMEKHSVITLGSLAESSGSPKYIPADKLSADIGAEQGSGVFGYYRFKDGSYLLLTCYHGVCVWDGKDESKAFQPRRLSAAKGPSQG